MHVLISSPNATFEVCCHPPDAGRRPIVGRGLLECGVEVGDVFRVTSQDSRASVRVVATQGGRAIASQEGPYVVVHREATGVAIEDGGLSRGILPSACRGRP